MFSVVQMESFRSKIAQWKQQESRLLVCDVKSFSTEPNSTRAHASADMHGTLADKYVQKEDEKAG